MLPYWPSSWGGGGRPAPPLMAHVPVCVHDDPEEARQAIAEQFRGFARAPFYRNMFNNAGFPEVTEGVWSPGMVDAVAVSGNEEQVTEGLQALLDMGTAEVMASPVAAGSNRDGSLDRTPHTFERENYPIPNQDTRAPAKKCP